MYNDCVVIYFNGYNNWGATMYAQAFAIVIQQQLILITIE